MIRCALCRTVVAPTSPQRIVDGQTYHAGCWDRKVREEAQNRKKP
jgi:hypothetical protein